MQLIGAWEVMGSCILLFEMLALVLAVGTVGLSPVVLLFLAWDKCWSGPGDGGSQSLRVRSGTAELVTVLFVLLSTGTLKHGMLGGAIQLTFRRMAFDYYPFHRAGRAVCGLPA